MIRIGTIGLPEFPLLLAPMEDVSDPPFRLVCKDNGADLLFTEFISSRGLVKETDKCRRRLDFFGEERPVGIQIFGGDEKSMGLAAAIVEGTNPDFLDINFGCPVKGIVNSGAGAGVLRDLGLMVRLTQACVRATRLPVTVKTRLGWDEESKNIEEVAERLQDAGIAALTIHGRTRCQLYKGSADWALIAKVKNNPRIQIPIFGNGDINSPEMAQEYKDRYGVDGMMIGRAAIGNPWIFREIRHHLKTGELLDPPDLGERMAVCRRHLRRSVDWRGPETGVRDMRRHYAHYLKGLPDATAYRKRLVLLDTAEEIGAVLDEIAATYRGLRFEREEIGLVNYHEHCAL
jgi:tRNA-dihydrouridine synthase B